MGGFFLKKKEKKGKAGRCQGEKIEMNKWIESFSFFSSLFCLNVSRKKGCLVYTRLSPALSPSLSLSLPLSLRDVDVCIEISISIYVYSSIYLLDN